MNDINVPLIVKIIEWAQKHHKMPWMLTECDLKEAIRCRRM